MPTIDWPEALVPQTAHLALRKAGVQFASPFNGTTQALDFVAERWALSASLATIAQRNPRGVRSFLNQLSGGVNRVRVWDFAGGGVPRGTLRGVPRLAVATVRGDVSITIKEAAAYPNLARQSGFEVDTDADGVADGWSVATAGTTGTISKGLIAGTSGNFQSLSAAGLGSTGADQVILQASDYVLVTAGLDYTFAADCWGSAGTTNLKLFVNWHDSGGAYISTTETSGLTLPTSRTRFSVTGEAPAGAARAFLRLRIDTRVGGPSACSFNVDNVQLERGGVASPWAGAATLKADDCLGLGGQLLQVAADCTADDSGRIVVPLVNRMRGVVAVDAAVTWSRPTCEMLMPSMQAGAVVRPGAIESAGLDLLEAW